MANKYDFNGKVLQDGDIIDVHQTINGQNLFIVVTVDPLLIVYATDTSTIYQYSKEGLLSPSPFNGEVDWEIISNIKYLSL